MTQQTWISDSNGNKCSVEYFGSKGAAQTALDSLRECDGCVNCSACSACSDCSGCSDCSDLDAASPTVAGVTATAPPRVPIIPNIHQTVFAAASAPEALDMRNWHACEKKHCRAGWVVALAGEAGKALERYFDTPLAAMKIYDASSDLAPVSPVRFFEDDSTALADMKRMAEAERAQAEPA